MNLNLGLRVASASRSASLGRILEFLLAILTYLDVGHSHHRGRYDCLKRLSVDIF